MIYWQSWSEFIHMDGYGAYVWGSLGMTLAVIALEVLQLRLRQRRLLRDETGEAP